jgi:hypothetical protein
LTNKPLQLEDVVATAGGNRRVSPRRYRPCHNALKAETRVRIPLEPLQTLRLCP